ARRRRTSGREATNVFSNACSCSSLSRVQVLVMDRSQAFAQVQHRVALARQQGVDADTRGIGDLLEALAFDFVRDEDLALLGGQLVERFFQLIEQDAAPDEAAQATRFAHEGRADRLVALAHGAADRRGGVHTSVKTDEARGYCAASTFS